MPYFNTIVANPTLYEQVICELDQPIYLDGVLIHGYTIYIFTDGSTMVAAIKHDEEYDGTDDMSPEEPYIDIEFEEVGGEG